MSNQATDLGSEHAFPRHDVTGSIRDGDGFVQTAVDGGLTKRELFAAMAMQGYCSCTANQDWTQKEIAADAVAQADALLTALDKTP